MKPTLLIFHYQEGCFHSWSKMNRKGCFDCQSEMNRKGCFDCQSEMNRKGCFDCRPETNRIVNENFSFPKWIVPFRNGMFQKFFVKCMTQNLINEIFIKRKYVDVMQVYVLQNRMLIFLLIIFERNFPLCKEWVFSELNTLGTFYGNFHWLNNCELLNCTI